MLGPVRAHCCGGQRRESARIFKPRDTVTRRKQTEEDATIEGSKRSRRRVKEEDDDNNHKKWACKKKKTHKLPNQGGFVKTRGGNKEKKKKKKKKEAGGVRNEKVVHWSVLGPSNFVPTRRCDVSGEEWRGRRRKEERGAELRNRLFRLTYPYWQQGNN
jgi:hypothetical protein